MRFPRVVSVIVLGVAATAIFPIMNPFATAKESPELPDQVTVQFIGPDGQTLPPETVATVKKSDAEWREQLDPEAYKILRVSSTERPFCSGLLDNKEKGVYFCAGCDLPLFTSASKFDSGTGWPSFFQPFADGNIGEERDTSHGMVRVEVHCARCGGHMGHVFPDGPPPTRLRYCINGAALTFRSLDEIAAAQGAN